MAYRMIIDAHVHICPEFRGYIADGDTRSFPYGLNKTGNTAQQVMPTLRKAKTAFTPDMLMSHMDWAGVDKAVILQGPFYGELNEYVSSAVGAYPDRLAGVACMDPWDHNAKTIYEEQIAGGSFVGLKLECSVSTGYCGIHPDAKLDDTMLAWLWNSLEQRRMVLVLDLGAPGTISYQTRAVRRIAQNHANLKIVIAHLAQPSPVVEADHDLWRLWEEQIDLGRLPNIWFDTASLPAYVSHEKYPYPTVMKYLRHAVDRIGAEKILWGTDIPGLLRHATYPQHVMLAELHAGFLSAREQKKILGENALELFFNG
jgi:predicted TIM-barrel fold metal-dependent hydrolase